MLDSVSGTMLEPSNEFINSIKDGVKASLDNMRDDVDRFINSILNIQTPGYLAIATSQFSARLSLDCIIEDAKSSIKTMIATIFERVTVPRPVYSPWLILHIAEVMSGQMGNLAQRHFFHIPASTGFLVVYLDERMMVNGRQIVYLCCALSNNEEEEENVEPNSVELFRRGVGMEEPDQENVKRMIQRFLYQIL